MSEQEKPILEEDTRIARILGAVLLVVVPTFGFYVSSALGKEWHFDYRPQDLNVALHGAGYGLLIAAIMNGYIWLRYRDNVNKDLVNEWYDPQAGHHH
jgi:hypothetical protein